LYFISENIRNMLLNKANPDIVKNYLMETVAMTNNNYANIENIYGYFNEYDAMFFGYDFKTPVDYLPQDQPWYKMAINKGGEIGFIFGYPKITLSRQLFSNDGSPLGIICLDMSLDGIGRHAVNMNCSENSYGMLLDSSFKVIAHAHPAFLGHYLSDFDGVIQDNLIHSMNIEGLKVVDYTGRKVTFFSRKLKNGLYLCLYR